MALQKNTSGQKWYVFAFDRTTNEPVTGDAANITAKIAKDYAAASALTDTNPAEVEDGVYVFDLTQAETNANLIMILPQSATANVQVVGMPAVVATIPVNFADDIVQTGDSYARIGSTGSGLTSLSTQSSVNSLQTTANNIYGVVDTEVAAIKAVTDALPDAGALTTIQADLDNIQTRIPAALVSGRMDSYVGSIATDAITASALSAAAATEIATAILDEAITAPSAAPTAPYSLRKIIAWLLAIIKFKRTQSSTTETVYDDVGTTAIATAAKSDDGTVFTRDEYLT